MCFGEVYTNGRPLVYPNWPPKSTKNHQPMIRPQMMIKLHNTPQNQPRDVYYNKRPSIMAGQRIIRPMMKVTAMPHFYSMKNPQYQHQASVYYTKSVSPPPPGGTFGKMKFKSSAKGPHNGEYIFETPFPKGFTPRPLVVSNNKNDVLIKKKN